MTTVGMTDLEMLGEHVMPGDVARVPIIVSGSILGMGSTGWTTAMERTHVAWW